MMKKIELTEDRVHDILDLIRDKYPEDLRNSPRHFLEETNGKASVYYYLLEALATLRREEINK